jgi:hypothetical protein
LRSNPLRYAPLGAHFGRRGLFCFTRSLIPHSRLLLPPSTPTGKSLTLRFFRKGAAAAYSCARLRVARANRAVTFFAVLRRLASHPFQRSLPCSLWAFRCAALSTLTPQHRFIPSKSGHSFAPFRRLHSVRSFLHLLSRQTPTRQKKSRQPCRFTVGSRSPHCVAGYPRLPPSLHSRTARALMQQPTNALRYRYAAFLVLRSGLFYLPFLTPPTPPTTTPENS